MRVVHAAYVSTRPTTLKKISIAPVLEDESPDLCAKFRKALLDSPEGFKYSLELEGFPVVHLEWVPVVQTAGALIFPPFVQDARRPDPDIVTLLVNGVESPADLNSLAMRYSVRADLWKQLLNAEKPIAFSLMSCVGRVREPATITIINAFANSFFGLFGTNESPGPD